MIKFVLAAGAASLALAAVPAFADDAKAPKPVSPFILCDGKTGHVGIGETLGRLLLITATAGLSEAAVATDDPSRKLDGASAAQACDTAIAQEGDSWRRAQLGTAKAVHLTEAGKLDDALAAIHAVPGLAGPLASEWGFQHSFMPRLMVIEAGILVRQKHAAEAEALTVRALRTAPYDVVLARRAERYLNLTPTLDADKAAALAAMARLLPESSGFLFNANIANGRYAEADADLAACEDSFVPFYTDEHAEEIQGRRAIVKLLMADRAGSDALAAKVDAALSDRASTGYSVKDAAGTARISEEVSLRSILRDAMDGHAKEARATFRAHGPWLLANQELVLAVTGKLRAGASADELTGTLADPPEKMRAKYLEQRLAALSDAKLLPLEYSQAVYVKEADYQRTSGATWKVGDKPKFLLKPGKNQLPTTDVLVTTPAVYGLPAGEALLLQAALIARSRHVDGFVMKPGRNNIAIAGMRFGKIGDPGMPPLLAFRADTVVADLSPHIPEPVTR